MQCINFDEKFQEYTAKWVQDNAAKYKNNFDAMEARMPDVYLQWLNEPADWLEGASPGSFFAQFDDAQMLTAWMCDYFRMRIPVPDQLLERLVALDGDAEQALLALVANPSSAPEEARLTAITLLSEMGSHLPADLYIERIAARAQADEYADMAAEALVAMGAWIVPRVLALADHANPYGQETFVDILCNFPRTEETYALTEAMFHAHPDKRALYASLLGKLGDERALPALLAAMRLPELGYLDYIELRNAVEALGGDPPEERIFDGDPYYESLKRME